MARQSLFDRYSSFIAGGVLGAHANTLKKGFRQHDVRFIIEIYTNWLSPSEEFTSLPMQNNQISRYLDKLVEDGFARMIMKKSYPTYRVTRAGLVELISRLTAKTHFNSREHCYFVYFFLEGYGKRAAELVRGEGVRFSYSLQLELETLLDAELFLNRQLEQANRELRMLDKKVEDAVRMKKITAELLAEGVAQEKIVSEVDKRLPFGYNTQRRLAEVFGMSTPRQAVWELQTGVEMRIKQLWMPTRGLLLAHIEQLKLLQQAAEEKKAESSS